MILVDTSVLLDIATSDPKWLLWSSTQIGHFANVEELIISPVIYAELAIKAPSMSDLDVRLSEFAFRPLTQEIAWCAAKAFEKYRAGGGRRERILGDFWIGAHAEVEHLVLLTRNPGDFARFNIRRMIAPGQNDVPLPSSGRQKAL